ncbi:MAG TPA: hypothetical protein VF210_11200 [Pseudomonadales bacterium]
MYDYLVLTAAVTRPELHSEVFPHYRALLGGARVKWLINVDDAATGASVEDTVANLARLLDVEGVDVEFLRGSSPCFFAAATRLAERAHEVIDECRIGVIWLEDDWMPSARGPLQAALGWLRLRLAPNRAGQRIPRCAGTLAEKARCLARLGPQRRWFVSLVPRSRVSFNPGIWSNRLFEEAFWQPLVQKRVAGPVDPEALCADPLNAAEVYSQLTVLVDPLFQDAGRQWSAARGAAKWSKEACSGGGHAVTYSACRPANATPMAADGNLCGWVLIRHPLLGPPLPLIGRIESRGERVTAHLLGVPSPWFELKVVAPGEAELYQHRLHAWARTYPFKKLPAHVYWQSDASGTLEVDDAGCRFRVPLIPALPWRALWIAPLQCVGGVLWWLADLVAALRHLDAERPPSV